MKNKRFLLVAMLLVLSTVLAACNFGGSDSSSDDKGSEEGGTKELNVVVASEPPSLHPQLATDTTSGAVLQNVFEGLTSTNEKGEVEMAAAEKVDVSEDLLTYTFTLRDAKWSNGDAVKAEDFAYAWTFALDPANASEYATILYPIKGAEAFNLGEGTAEDLGIEVKDDKTLVVTLENPTPYFLELTAFKTYYPIHKATAEGNAKWSADAGESYVTNGAYLLKEWNHQSDIVLEKNPEYWDADNVKIDRVNIGMVEEETTAITMFESGEIDYLGSPYQTVSLDAIDRLNEQGILNIADYAGIYWYKFNTTDPITSNVNIRKALTLAIDRENLIKNVTKGEEAVATGMVPTAVKGFENSKGYFEDANFEEAKKYLEKGMAELGLSDPSEIKIGLSYNTSEGHQKIAQFIQEGWYKNLGIDVTLDNSEWQVYLEKLNQLDYQVGRMGWIADYNDASTFLEQYDTAKNGNNDTGWENPQYKALLDQAKTETDEAKRVDILRQAEAIAMDELPIAPIYYYTNRYVVKDYVKNMQPDVLGNIALKNVDIEK